MDQRRAIIAVAAVILLILVIIGGTIFYLARVFNSGKSTTTGHVVTSSNAPAANNGNTLGTESLPSTSGSTPLPANYQIYQGQGFQLRYPKTWGLLTCTNSNNFEFDPYTGQNQKVGCDFAVKPITVLVNKNECQGGTVTKINNIPVTKVVDRTDTGVDYEWCTQTNPPLDVTERVSSDGSRATSVNDYSIQVEQMIGSFSNAGGGS